MTDSQSGPEQRPQNPKVIDFQNSEKNETPGKIQTPGQERIQTHGNQQSR